MAPRSGELFLRLADALQALDATPSSLPSGRAGATAAAALSAPGLGSTAAVASPFSVAMTAATAAETEIAAAIDVDGPVGDNSSAVVVVDDGGGRGAEGEEGRREVVVAPMEDLVLEPPALAAAGRAEEAAAAMAAMAAGRGGGRKRGTAAEEDGEGGKGAASMAAALSVASATAAANSARASEEQQHLDHVLEALVRARGIVLPRSRCVCSGLKPCPLWMNHHVFFFQYGAIVRVFFCWRQVVCVLGLRLRSVVLRRRPVIMIGLVDCHKKNGHSHPRSTPRSAPPSHASTTLLTPPAQP